MSKNWEHAAGILWPKLLRAAKAHKKLTYGDLAPSIKTNPLSVGRALGPIMYFCWDNKLPPLTAIVVGKTTGIPGPGFIAWDVDDIDSAYELVFQFNWDAVKNPYGGYGKKDTSESFAKIILKDPSRSEEIYSRVKVRGTAQRVFRLALLEAYDWECAICGFSFSEALEAAHIVTWSKATHSQRMSPNNGVLLCSNHHKLFDSGYIRISEDLRVLHVDKHFEENYYGAADISATAKFHLKKIRLPKKKALWPDVQLIRERYRRPAKR